MVTRASRNVKSGDDTRYCDRCAISFVWTVEEQKGLAPGRVGPTHCPGCRRLLPPAGRERGLVKWYNGRRRYGFIVRSAAAEIFVHGSALRSAAPLHSGDLVEFAVAEGAEGPAAVDVELLAREEG